MTLGVLGDHLVIQPCLSSQCDESGHHSREHPVMPFSWQVFYSWALEPEIHSTYFMLLVFASFFRLLVTLHQSSRSEVSPSSNTMNHYGRSSFNQRITTRVISMSSPFYIVTLPVLPFCMGYPEEMLSFARHTNLCIHDSENHMFL